MKKRKFISFMAVIVWMSLLFFLSSQPATESGALSRNVTQMIISFVQQIFPSVELDLQGLHGLVRKSAHFFGYFVLGLLVMTALGTSNIRGNRRVVITLFICLAYAIADEIHQVFIPGRAGQVVDVIIDTSGSLVGILIYLVFARLRKYSERENQRAE